jgi:hypothetical protein
MSKYGAPIKIAISFISLALLLTIGFLLTSGQKSTESAPASTSDTDGKTEYTKLRQVVDATVAKLGATGWTEVNTSTNEVIVFDPSSKLEYQIATYTPKSSNKGSVLGSVMIGPFDLMMNLEERTEDFKVYETEAGFGLKYIDTLENGTSVTEYEVQDGVMISATVRDRIGKKNELNVVTQYFYGLDNAGKKALVYANNHIEQGGHD